MEDLQTNAEPFRLLFVCTGNTCRSPLAEVIARKRVHELGWSQFEVASAGVGAFAGSPASGGSARTAALRGLDLSEHGATLLTHDLAQSADLVLTMSAGHLLPLIEWGLEGKAAVITAFAAGDEDGPMTAGVPDPIGGPDEEYAHTFDVIDDLVARSLARLEPMMSP